MSEQRSFTVAVEVGARTAGETGMIAASRQEEGEVGCDISVLESGAWRGRIGDGESEFVYSSTAAVGMVDAFRQVHADEVANHGWTYSPIFTQTQDRIDYVYYKGKMLKAVAAEVISEHAEKFPSDHAAVLVTFEVE